MKRVIKFRSAHYTRDGKFSHFSYWGMIDPKMNPSEDCFTSPSSHSSTYRKAEDQFTGLTDKNGVDIYESCELDNKWKVVYKLNKYVLQSISNSDIFTEILKYEEYTITREYC